MSSKGSEKRSRGALFVALGIFLSRILGLVRERVFAHFLGNSAAADAFKAAIRIPNLLQNLLGEGVLSASFIPTYSSLLVREKQDEARSLAYAVFRSLALLVTLVSAVGVLISPLLVGLIAPGFEGEKRELTILLTRIFFPSTSLLVLSAWCLGISNSHHRFFLPYAAPVIWNAVMISTLLFFGQTNSGNDLATMAAWGAVVGSLLQFLIQVPQVRVLLASLRSGKSEADPDTVKGAYKHVLSTLLPVVFGRGIVQISAYADGMIASLLGGGAVSALSYAQTIYLLPVSLFGMSVSAAELPGMSRLTGGQGEREPEEQAKIHQLLGARLYSGTRQIAFFVIPSAVAFLFLGRELIAAAFQTGQFQNQDTEMVWYLLGALSLGLVPTTFARLNASTFYALHDTKTPVRCASVRVGISVALSFVFALLLPRLLSWPERMGLIGLGFASAIGATTEFFLLRRELKKRIQIPSGVLRLSVLLAFAAIVSAGGAHACLAFFLRPHLGSPLVQGATVSLVFGIFYLFIAVLFGVPEVRKLRLRR